MFETPRVYQRAKQGRSDKSALKETTNTPLVKEPSKASKRERPCKTKKARGKKPKESNEMVALRAEFCALSPIRVITSRAKQDKIHKATLDASFQAMQQLREDGFEEDLDLDIALGRLQLDESFADDQAPSTHFSDNEYGGEDMSELLMELSEESQGADESLELDFETFGDAEDLLTGPVDNTVIRIAQLITCEDPEDETTTLQVGEVEEVGLASIIARNREAKNPQLEPEDEDSSDNDSILFGDLEASSSEEENSSAAPGDLTVALHHVISRLN